MKLEYPTPFLLLVVTGTLAACASSEEARRVAPTGITAPPFMKGESNPQPYAAYRQVRVEKILREGNRVYSEQPFGEQDPARSRWP